MESQDILHGRSKGESCTGTAYKGENHRSWFDCRSQRHFWSSKTSKVGSAVVWDNICLWGSSGHLSHWTFYKPSPLLTGT